MPSRQKRPAEVGDGKTAAAGRACEPAKGQVYHLVPGHTREALLHPMYKRLLRNAVAWCVRQEPPLPP